MRFIQNVFRGLKQTLVPNNVRSVFRMLVLELDVTQTPYTLLFREEKLRQNQGFREIWEADNPWTDSPKEERRDLDGSTKTSRLKQPSFSVILRTRSADIGESINLCGVSPPRI
jgi:hypothetical protein